MNELKTIRLYGKLGALFGREHKLAIRNPAEAVRALCVLKPGFEKYMLSAHLFGVRFAVFKGKQNIGADELCHESGDREIRIAPVIAGRKNGGILQIVLGAVMVVAGVLLTVPTGGASLSLAFSGGAMIAGGIMQMLSPQPAGLAMRQEAENAPSYAFGGPVNTTAIGNPVGVLYGEREIGGAIISAGIFTEDIKH
ncbi:hypothetical protein SB5439_04980 [Klebsiella variicola]|uniref:tail assembly protein n=1 Tax=Klebsiella variicola TaxID=244366 RepID=UPI00109D56F2|nr:tail assembly protein [Klebsiella variicola]VGQ11667.1 hypothetical protein SB5439_04980 [Klebsiella variicola]